MEISKCPNSPDGFHYIPKGPFLTDPSKSDWENQKALEEWKRDSHPSDQFCLFCHKAIW